MTEFLRNKIKYEEAERIDFDFDMGNDTINCMKSKLGFSSKKLLTDEAVPSKFHCQDDSKRRLRSQTVQKDDNVQEVIELDKETPKTKFCITCLKRNVPLVGLSSCEHADMLNLLEIKFQLNNFICSWCHITVKKIHDFKIQALNSHKILNSELQNSANKYLQPLEFSKIELQSTIHNQPIELQTTDHTVKNELTDKETTFEIKIEQDVSDYENDLPFVEINKTDNLTDDSIIGNNIIITQNKTTDEKVQIKKRTQSKKNPKLPQTKKSKGGCGMWYEDKVKTVQLTEEEMLHDRELDAANNKYLKSPYKCQKCIIGFDHNLAFNQHMELRHKKVDGALICNICESVQNTKSAYKAHRNRHYRRYECLHCKNRFTNVRPALNHYKNTHGNIDIKYACKQCDFTTESYSRLRFHRDYHHKGEIKPECDLCGNVYANKDSLRTHILNIHKLTNHVFACGTCGKEYRTRAGLRSHVLLHNKKDPPAYCADCDITFRNAAGLKQHLRNTNKHNSENIKRFTCNECNESFRTKRELQDHIDFVHLNRTNYTCSKCPKSYMNKKRLRIHILYVHDKIRRPRDKICDHCGRDFDTSIALITHIRSHTGERPLKCAHCAATFAHSGALYTHNKLVHKKKKPVAAS